MVRRQWHRNVFNIHLRKICCYWTAVSKNIYFDELNDTVDEYNNTYNTIKMKPIDVKSNPYTEYNVDPNAKKPKFKIGDHVRISKYEIIFAKWYAPNWSEELFVISKIKNNGPWTCTSGSKWWRNCWKFLWKRITKKQEFRIEKVFKRKGNKLYVRSKGMIIQNFWKRH